MNKNSQSTCRTCANRQRMETAKSIGNYCALIQSRRTCTGHLKVRYNQPACTLYQFNENKSPRMIEADRRQTSMVDIEGFINNE